jgi:hypothetical protein
VLAPKLVARVAARRIRPAGDSEPSSH